MEFLSSSVIGIQTCIDHRGKHLLHLLYRGYNAGWKGEDFYDKTSHFTHLGSAVAGGFWTQIKILTFESYKNLISLHWRWVFLTNTLQTYTVSHLAHTV